MKKQRPLYRLLLVAALVGVCTSSLATCASAAGTADTDTDVGTVDTTVLETLEVSAPAEEDIRSGNVLETYFASTNGGWDTDSSKDSVKDGALRITQGASVRTVTYDVDEAGAFEVEVRVKIENFGPEIGFKYEYNGQRIMTYFRNTGISVNSSSGSYTVDIANMNDWHTFKFTVNGSQAMLYVDDEYKLSFGLQPWTNCNGLLTFFVKGSSETNPAALLVDHVKFAHDGATISITSPLNESSFVQGGKLYIKSKCVGEAEGAPYVDYYVNNTYIGTATLESVYTLEWSNLVPGAYSITAKYGELESIPSTITVVSATSSIIAEAEDTELALGESTTVSLRRLPSNVKSVTFYANGAQLPPSANDANTAVYTAGIVGNTVIQAKVTYENGSYEYSDEVAVKVSSDSTAGVVLQSSYTLDFTASDGAVIAASDGIYALDMSFASGTATYESAEGTKTYPLGVGNYKVQVDGGSAEVYYNGQYAYSFLMPVSAKANGITATGVSGLTVSGLNATRLTLKDGDSVIVPDFKQDYAVEWVLDAPKNFALDMNDGVYNIDLEAKGGSIIAQTYPNGDRGVVEEVTLCTLPAGRHVYRLAVSNGIAQLFIDNVWAASLRLPVVYSERYAKVSGIDTVYVRETSEVYIHEDSFDGTAEFGSDVYWRALNGKIVTEFGNGTMTVAPDPDYEEPDYSVFYDSFDKSSSTWSGGSFVISDGYLTVSTDDSASAKTTAASVGDSKNFEFEIKARVLSFGAENGIKLEFANSRVMTYLGTTGFRIHTSENGTNVTKTYPVDTAQWHTYKFVVTEDGKKCEFFIDDVSQASFNMPVWGGTSNPKISVFVKASQGGTASMEVDYVSYVMLDNDASAAAQSPIREAVPALIKAFAFDPHITTTVRVDEAPAEGGGVYVALRYDNEYRNILAGYNFDLGAWEIVQTNTTSKSIASSAAEFPYGKDVKLEITVNDDQIVLYVDGERETSTNQATLNYYGNVGIAVDGVKAVVSDFAYSGTGRAIPGADTFINTASSPEVFEYEEGHIYVINGSNNAFESTDDGYTWEKVSLGKYSNNTIRLKSGTIVYTVRRNEGDGNYVDYSYVSTDNGETFEGPFPIQDYLRNRITMNNKLTEGSTGRLFFASGESGDGVEGEGGVRVFYSDDEGRTWTGANILALDGKTIISGKDEARMDAENTGVNCQESRVVEMPDGTLRLYVRTDEGFLYYSISTDNGVTWTAEMWASEFISVLSAFNIEYEPSTGYYYMAWEYNNKNDNRTFQYPRTRTGLAVSYDGMETWEYIGDIHEAANSSSVFNHMNIGLKPTTDAIYVTTVYYPLQEDGSAPVRNYMVRVDKDTLKTTERFTKVHALSTAAPNTNVANIIDTMLVVDADYTNIYSSGKIYSISDPTKGFIPASIAASFVGAHTTVNGSSITLKLGAVETVFTAGLATANVNGEAKVISAAPIMKADGLYVPITILTELYGKTISTAKNGSTISINDVLGAIALVDIEELAKYLPTGISDTASTPAPVSAPSTWAAAEVNAALSQGIVPASLQSAYTSGITRAEFCTLIMTMLNKVNGTADSKALVNKLGITYADNFTDTDNADIVSANLIGIVNGRGNGIFDPNAGITRQEAAVMLANAAKVLGIVGGSAPAFTDLGSAGSWAVDAINTVTSITTASGSTVMGGVGNNMFSPLGTYTREQSILTVYRLYMSM